ncbi:Glycosyltransferase involved in cell wall bisynthesis [Flavobacterium resistens]|uniref:Glycosyltransferase n=1 Tax=Flavobacterium resistens TaxID=443612 RepID=A0A521C0W3_9FLAO|nr:glycosyltransferase family 2 protein [Flavobacterium resistens]MRX69726.1 glycosyltransferase [Flavobacterium resistens]SMO52350.1 Glycosyltransferase involved in cell wall bisynthesis [Flavobacterium resistens]
MNIQKESILFSIIVPVYNVEAYLLQCLDSILCQTFSDFELILINDGSTDSSLEICRKYKEKFPQIILIDKENGGLSDARNTGLLLAKGDYIIFTDSDDYWQGKQVLEDLSNLISKTNPDIIIHEESRFFSKNDVHCKYNQRFIKNKNGKFEDEIVNLVYHDLYVASAWDKVIKREILVNNKLFFPVGRKSEDIEWCSKLMYYLNTFSIYPKSFYVYRQAREGSITTTVSAKHIEDVYEMVKAGLHSQKMEAETLNKAIENYWACNYVVILKDFYVLSAETQKKIWHDLISWKYLLKKGRNIKVDKVMKFYKFLSFKTLIFFLNGYRLKRSLNKKRRASK